MSFVQVSRPRDGRGGRGAAGRPLQLSPQHRRARVRTRTPSQPWAVGDRRRGLCGVNDALLHQALCAVASRPQHSLLLKTFPVGFPRRGSPGRARGAARGIRRRQEGKLPQLPPWKGARPQDQDPETRRRIEEENEAWPRLWPRGHRGKSLQGLRKASRHPGWPYTEARCPAKPAFLGLTVRPSSLNTTGCRQFFTEINPAKKH